MTTSKTPLQAVVSVICDCLADLSADEQARALEAASVTLGLLPAKQLARDAAYQDTPATRLPIVQVEMMGDRPMVVSPPPARPGRGMVVVGRQRPFTQLRDAAARAPVQQLSAPRVEQLQAVRGYIRSLR